MIGAPVDGYYRDEEPPLEEDHSPEADLRALGLALRCVVDELDELDEMEEDDDATE